MYSLLLAVIYLIFMSLGLPDSLLGSGWPTMQVAFKVPSSYAGYVSMAISFMTIISALISASAFWNPAADYRDRNHADVSSDLCGSQYRIVGENLCCSEERVIGERRGNRD